ncbi:LOB domain-containing protein [Arachis hypogaea]|nr:LOB domain-containing protein [Arachis hypogaea]
MQRNNNGMHPACAACKHQRKKCSENNCILAPYFPANRSREFHAVHKVFGVSNITKLVKSAKEEDRRRVVDSLIWEACCRQRDPIHGPYGEYTKVYNEYKKVFNELKIFRGQNTNTNTNTNNNHHHQLLQMPLPSSHHQGLKSVQDLIICNNNNNNNTNNGNKGKHKGEEVDSNNTNNNNNGNNNSLEYHHVHHDENKNEIMDSSTTIYNAYCSNYLHDLDNMMRQEVVIPFQQHSQTYYITGNQFNR